MWALCKQRDGAAEACGAHNPEVPGSKPGLATLCCFPRARLPHAPCRTACMCTRYCNVLPLNAYAWGRGRVVGPWLWQRACWAPFRLQICSPIHCGPPLVMPNACSACRVPRQHHGHRKNVAWSVTAKPIRSAQLLGSKERPRLAWELGADTRGRNTPPIAGPLESSYAIRLADVWKEFCHAPPTQQLLRPKARLTGSDCKAHKRMTARANGPTLAAARQ